MKKQKIILICFIILLVIMSIGVTYSWLSWNSKNDMISNITIGSLVDYEFKTSNQLTTNELAPVLNYTDGEVIDFTLRNRETSSTKINIYFVINNISDELKNNSFKYKLISSLDNKIYTEIAGGNFSSVSTEDNFYILTNKEITNIKAYYKLYVYIDGNNENNNNMMNKIFDGSLNMEITK